ncbi:hypothetical protein AVEN_132100-1 [Araneus ventricosus]|uniref:Uncharacterized protein n=1 Tax=Araneus ventricosus TaxID=182803 RepID=A0A4Y2FAJ6_ARAVE|nr:hypothetical protein AVEN_132100-1 [Araneus ventricosus]
MRPKRKVSASGPEGSRFDIRFHSISAVYCSLLHVKSKVGGQTSSLLCGAKLPTLARPTQEGCKAGRGPAGREPPQQHVKDGIYWVQ